MVVLLNSTVSLRATDIEQPTVRKVNCNLCGRDDFVVVFPKGYAQLHQIVRCKHCGLMYANPQELVDCQTFAEADRPETYDPNQGRQYFEKEHVQIPDNLRALGVLNSLCPKKGKLLEIGSFLGIFLDRIRQDGWQVVGLEPDPGPAKYARTKYGLPIVDGTLPNPKFQNGEFDAVMMLHVIEHMPDPSENLREIRRITKTGGVLVIETPRFDSLMFRLLGHRERSIQNCQGHIYFFTRSTLRQLVEKHQFQVERTELVGRTLTVDRLLYNVALMSRSQRIMRWAGWLGQKLKLNRLRLHVNARDMQRIYARAVPSK